jgi:hypothetical protein
MPAKKRAAAKAAKTPVTWPRRLVFLCAVAAAVAGAVLYAENRLASPDIKLLIPEHGARWIRQNRPFRLTGWGPTQEVVFFRRRVNVPAGTTSAVVTVRALRACIVYWDQRQVLVAAKPDEWKDPHSVTLKNLTPGEHAFEVFVEDSFGPAALLVSSEALDLNTGPGWDEHVLGEDWKPALLADDVAPPPPARPLDSAPRALAKSLVWLGPLFLAVWAGLMWITRGAEGRVLPRGLTSGRVRWIVLAAWFVLAANNFLKLPAELGYDLPSHVDYIRFIAERGELPDAHDGLQMFQAPVFYALAAGLYRLLTLFLASGTALLGLRWLTLFCGMAQVEICFRAGRCVFPDREDLQILTVLVGGLLPMNVYMSQTLGNEPLCGALTALVLLWCWQALREPATPSRRAVWRLGILFGLDLLTKMSALLFAPVIGVVLAVVHSGRGVAVSKGGVVATPKTQVAGRGVATSSPSPPYGGVGKFKFGLPLLLDGLRCFGAAVIVAGWYYGRNYLRFGKFLVGGWDPVRGVYWWQDPGYRTPWQMISFGRSLCQPIHAGFYSIADGFFASLWLDGNFSGWNDWESRPPWNLTLLLAACWPALVLSAAIAAGSLRAVWCRDAGLRRCLQLAGGSLLLYVAAFVLLWLEVPAFSQAKASYTLGLTPAYAVLCVAGLDLLPANRSVRSAVTAFVVCWSVLVYATYFAR